MWQWLVLCIAMAFAQTNTCNMYILYVQFFKSDVTLFFYDHIGLDYGETCLVFCLIIKGVPCLMVFT